MSLKDLLEQERMEDTGEIDGQPVWLPLPSGGEAHVTYAQNPEFRKKLTRLQNRYRREHRIKADKPIEDVEAAIDMAREAMVGTLVKAIRDVPLDGSGAMVPNTPEGILQVLQSRKNFQRIDAYVADEATFAAENLEIVSGNSAASSAGD